jgi:hypothetical protein
MGSVFKPKAPPPPKPDPAIEAARQAEEDRKRALEIQEEGYQKKVAKGIIGVRSLFGRAGGRGFFG